MATRVVGDRTQLRGLGYTLLALIIGCLSAPLLAESAGKSSTGAEKTQDIEKVLKDAHAKFKGDQGGKNADYIPALAEVDPKLFGISLVTVDGKAYDVGDVESPFSIQSISKVFTLALVMQSHGEDDIIEKVGVDATGQPFNSINAIEDIQERSVNSFVNAGAIATASLVCSKTADEKWTKISRTYNAFAGRELALNEPVYKSESETNQRNQAIAMLLDAYERIYDDPEMTVDLYTRQCSVNVTAHDLAMMAGTLANHGVNPVTGKRVINAEHVPQILAVMATAGLYDDSGIWLYNVSLPAKSGVGGGIIAVAPGRFGIAAFSPPLDPAGNSVRAQKAITYVSQELGANVFE